MVSSSEFNALEAEFIDRGSVNSPLSEPEMSVSAQVLIKAVGVDAEALGN